MGTTVAADYSRPVLVKREGKVVEVTLNDIQIPDLWHVSRAASDAIDRLAEVERLIDEHDGGDAGSLLEKLLSVTRGDGEAPETPDGKRVAEAITDVWHTAIDLKKNLAGDVEKPAAKRKGKKA